MNANSVKEQLKVTRLIYVTLGSGQIILFVIVLILIENTIVGPNRDLDELFRFLIPAVGFVAMVMSHRIYIYKISNLKMDIDLIAKSVKYRNYKIAQWAMTEFASLISLAGFLITGNYLYVIVFLFLIGFFILNRPSELQFKIDFRVSEE
jgi:hypothetical protein